MSSFSDIVDTILENEDRCRCVIEFLRDVIYFDASKNTNFQSRNIDDVDKGENASDLSFSMLHSILNKRSDLRTQTIASRLVMPFMLFWVCGNAKLPLSGTLPQVLKDIRDLIIHFIGYRLQNAVCIFFYCQTQVHS